MSRNAISSVFIYVDAVQFIPAQWLELACCNRPMVVYSYAVETQRARPSSEIEDLLLNLLSPERRKLRGLK